MRTVDEHEFDFETAVRRKIESSVHLHLSLSDLLSAFARVERVGFQGNPSDEDTFAIFEISQSLKAADLNGLSRALEDKRNSSVLNYGYRKAGTYHEIAAAICLAAESALFNWSLPYSTTIPTLMTTPMSDCILESKVLERWQSIHPGLLLQYAIRCDRTEFGRIVNSGYVSPLELTAGLAPMFTSRFNWQELYDLVHLEYTRAQAKPASVDSPALNIFRKDSDTWTFRFKGGDIKTGVADKKGAQDLQFLLRNVGKEVDVFALPNNSVAKPRMTSTSVATKFDFQIITQQIIGLQAELESETDVLVQNEIKKNIEALRDQRNQNFGKKGEPRKLPGDVDKALDATRRRIGGFIRDNLAERIPELAAHLTKNVQIARECGYLPEIPIDWDLGKKF